MLTIQLTPNLSVSQPAFTIGRGKIVQIEMLADPASISKLDLSILER
jgi:hypothetical protein